MTMTIVWCGMIVLSICCGIITGNTTQVASAAMEGASAAVELTLSIGGMMCLWTGVMEVMRCSGLAGKVSKLLSPVLRRLFPAASKDQKTLDTICANVSANLLGLGNAATPLGISAARRMSSGCRGIASNELCMLVVCNTASIQLIPTTVATVRATAGAATPFDILPAVWLSSAISVCVGIAACKLFSALWARKAPYERLQCTVARQR